MRVNAYIDGFNLYHGSVKRRPACKWLDLAALCRHLIPSDCKLQRVRYFTARVGSGDADPGQPQRQDVYLRALAGMPFSELGPTYFNAHEGKFQTERSLRPLVGSSELVKVRLTEEKGSDVNLATYLLLDAFDGDMETALVVSDDFDLEEPLRVIRERFDVRLGIASPRSRRELSRAVGADFYKPIHEALLLASQFPDVTYDDKFREVRRPAAWSSAHK